MAKGDATRVVDRTEIEFGIDDFGRCVADARSVRVYDESDPVERELLVSFVDMARKTASAGNLQTLRYHVVTEPREREELFACLGWAAYLKDWPGPGVGERPTGYVVVFNDGEPKTNTWIDCGIACQTMVLAACEAGIGSCMLRSFSAEKVRRATGVDDDALAPVLVVSFGTPAQTIELEPVGADGSIVYHVDADGVHRVPKRALSEALV